MRRFLAALVAAIRALGRTTRRWCSRTLQYVIEAITPGMMAAAAAAAEEAAEEATEDRQAEASANLREFYNRVQEAAALRLAGDLVPEDGRLQPHYIRWLNLLTPAMAHVVLTMTPDELMAHINRHPGGSHPGLWPVFSQREYQDHIAMLAEVRRQRKEAQDERERLRRRPRQSA